MDPKRMSVAIYKDSKTLELAELEKMIVLQLLSKDQINLVKQLGFKSGKSIDKISYLEKRDWSQSGIILKYLATHLPIFC